ncbi:MAG: 2,3-bisphosphoglycerate-independent phosphoglycerate mutase, partial [Candidatus Dormibacteraeota bacterium]|nr:2,3-bisphosphoglycerate-independent phosphoglycerate mutase [Candidatus Dormibacteraeota bacterium]
MTWERAVLVILDGFGCAPEGPGNAIRLAGTPNLDRLLESFPHTLLDASGMAVGLPRGQQGNSEVGHLTIGSGRVVLQDLTRISAAIEDQSFFDNPVLLEAMRQVLSRGSNLHILGLVSPGGVHSHQDHLVAVCELARRQGLTSVKVHAFTDGRDTPPESGAGFLEALERDLRKVGVGEIASVSGRYYAMDRDQRWDRLERAYLTLTGRGERTFGSAVDYVRRCYAEGTTDEFIEPAAIVAPGSAQTGIRAGDVVIHCNFRPDRAREMCHALLDREFAPFERDPLPQ